MNPVKAPRSIPNDPVDSERVAFLRTCRTTWALAATIYLVTAIVYFALPVWHSFGESLLGTTLFAPDNVVNAGILEWGYKAFRSSSLHFFDWPSGYPVRNSLAGTEYLLGWQPFFIPQRMLGVGVVAAYNVCVLLSLVISGLAANVFARRCGVSPDGALVAGFVFAFAPVHIGVGVHLQALAICWLPLGLAVFERLMTERGVSNVIGLAVIVAVAALASLYYGVFLVLLLAVWWALGLATGRFAFSPPALARLAAAAALTLAALLPVVAEFARMSSAFGFDRSLEYSVRRSIGVAEFFHLQRWLLLWGNTPLRQGTDMGAAFPGFVVLALTAAGVRWKADRRLKLMLVVAAGLCVLLSLGPRLKLFNYPISFLANIPMPGSVLRWIPGLRQPSRLLPCAFIFLSVLVGGGASVLIAHRQEWRAAIVTALLLLLALDAFPAPSFSAESWRLESPVASSDAYEYLARTPAAHAVVELPLRDSTGFDMPVQSAYVYGSVGHLQRVAAYRLSVRLPAADSLQAAAERLPDESERRFLLDRGVGRLVVHRRFAKADSISALLSRLDDAGYIRVFQGREATVYLLERIRSHPPRRN